MREDLSHYRMNRMHRSEIIWQFSSVFRLAGKREKFPITRALSAALSALPYRKSREWNCSPAKKRGLKLYFEKDGIYADISVRVDYGYNVPEVAFKIQQTVKHNVEAMTEYKVAKVDVYVAGVDFSEERSAEQN